MNKPKPEDLLPIIEKLLRLTREQLQEQGRELGPEEIGVLEPDLPRRMLATFYSYREVLDVLFACIPLYLPVRATWRFEKGSPEWAAFIAGCEGAEIVGPLP